MRPFTPPDADEWIERLQLQLAFTDVPGFREAVAPPAILLGRCQSARDQRWLIFHAIGHVHLHRGNQLAKLRTGNKREVDKQEKQAESWAARTLIPAQVLYEGLQEGLTTEDLCDLFAVPSGRLDFAIRVHGAKNFEEQTEYGTERTIVPSAADLEAYLRDKDAIDQQARLSGWKPGQSRGGAHGW